MKHCCMEMLRAGAGAGASLGSGQKHNSDGDAIELSRYC